MRTMLRCCVLAVSGLGLVAGCSKAPEAPPPAVPSYAVATYGPPAAATEAVVPVFTDVTAEAGIAFTHATGAFGKKWMPETMGGGCAWLDYDGDDWLDLLLVNGREWPGHETLPVQPTQRLYRNRGDGTFEDVTAAAGLNIALYGMGCAAGDYDGDGDTDIYLTAVGDNVLLRNDGGVFVDVTDEAGVAGNAPEPDATPAWSTGAAWLDSDRDGLLDLFVVNYVKWTPETDIYTTLDGKTKSYATPEKYQGESCRLYRNLGGGRFADVTEAAGVLNHNAKSLAVSVADFNNDGAMDLVVANDTEANLLYRNRGDGTFEEIALAAGVAYDENGRARAGMGIDVADYENDGRQAIAIGNFSREPVSLFQQVDAAFFQDRAGRARLAGPTLLSLTFGLLFADFNLDGYQDLVIANGHVEPEINAVQRDVTYAQPTQLFLNDGAGGFFEATARAGEALARPVVGRGLASADYDRDGDIDLALTTSGGPAYLLRNDLPPGANRGVRVRLIGAPPNTAALGARLVAHSGDLTQRRLVRTGSSYLSQSELTQTFGLGSRGGIEVLEVHWPQGRVDRYKHLAAGGQFVIDEARHLVQDSRSGGP